MQGLATRLFLLTCNRERTTLPSEADDCDYFSRGLGEADEFCAVFPDGLEVQGKRVLDLGCGHGSLCMRLAARGAREVVGFDLDAARITFAERLRARRPPEQRAHLRFTASADAIGSGTFGVIVSKDTLEHVASPQEYLRDVAARLDPGGRFYAGFSPLWNSPFGGHGRLRTRLPWGHLLFPEPVILRGVKALDATVTARSIADMGLNQMSFRMLNDVIQGSGLQLTFFAANVPTYSRVNKLMTRLRRVPLLTEYLTHSAYFVLEKPKTDG